MFILQNKGCQRGYIAAFSAETRLFVCKNSKIKKEMQYQARFISVHLELLLSGKTFLI